MKQSYSKYLLQDCIFTLFLFCFAVGVLILLVCFSPYEVFLHKNETPTNNCQPESYVDLRNKA